VTAEDVAAVCEALDSSGDPSVYDDFAQKASDALFILSGEQFAGECGPIVVRPCDRTCECVHPGRSWGWFATGQCGCLSRVKLSGYPVREIVEVLIDGVVIDPAEYRLDGHRFLTRLADADGKAQRWPHGQRLDLATTEEDTWSIEYTYGLDPPALGLNAALELACQLAHASPGSGGECDLPAGVTQVVRQGITFEMGSDVWEALMTLPMVGLFLMAYNPNRLRRRSTIWSPDVQGYAKKYG
jgi:hypothetical protein